eukprot:ANDGO_08056.mRNA.1 hypothetical protein
MSSFGSLLASCSSSATVHSCILAILDSPQELHFSSVMFHARFEEHASAEDRLLLDIFSRGSVQDYEQAVQSGLISTVLSDEARLKLGYLSVLSAALQTSSGNKIAFDDLKMLTCVQTDEQVELLVLEAIERGLIVATIDQKERCVRVSKCLDARDVISIDQIAHHASLLQQWLTDSELAIASMEKALS